MRMWNASHSTVVIPRTQQIVRPMALAVALLCSACEMSPEPSEDAGTPDPTPSATLPPDQYCEETVDAFCDFYLRCGRMDVDTVEQCRSLFLESCNAKYEQRYADLVNA